uniref:Iodothyronine deiodinase n=1 Tax=Mastacembelus armatus TaxID=205130 RepID=A0A3Q3KW99_9TELE
MFFQKLMVYFSTACMFCYMIGFNLTVRIMHFIMPSLTKKHILRMGEKITMTQNPKFRYEDWGPTFKSFQFIKAASRHMWLSLGQEAFLDGDAPDSSVFTMDGRKTSICKYLKGASWTFTLLEFKQLVKDFRDVADFLVVYIAEAHSTDGWAFTNNYNINQHRSLEDRLSAARILVQKEPLCPVVVDEMDDVTAIKYGALPERLYVLQAGKVVYKGGTGPWGYNPLEVRSFLEKLK